jgi:hypothetical protein
MLSSLVSEYLHWISLSWTILGVIFLGAFVFGCKLSCSESKRMKEYQQDSWDAEKLSGRAAPGMKDPATLYDSPEYNQDIANYKNNTFLT